MNIGIVIDSGYQPIPHTSKIQARVHDRLDVALIDLTKQSGTYGITLWGLINEIAAAENPPGRTARRELNLELWRRLRRLLKEGTLFRAYRNWIRSTKPPKLPRSHRHPRRVWIKPPNYVKLGRTSTR